MQGYSVLQPISVGEPIESIQLASDDVYRLFFQFNQVHREATKQNKVKNYIKRIFKATDPALNRQSLV